MEFKTEADSGEEDEVNMEILSATNPEEQEEDGDIVYKVGSSSDSKLQSVSEIVKRGRKRNLDTILYDNRNFNPLEYPVHLTLKGDIKEVAKNHIIRYLPAKTLARSRLVSRDFNKWIGPPFFALMQSRYFRKTSGFFSSDKGFNRFTSLDKSAYGVPTPSLRFLAEAVSIRSSGNGLLLCQAIGGEREYYICNPANKQFNKLPTSGYYHGENPKIVLAFEPYTLNFKPSYQVVCPFSLPDTDVGPIVYFDIYDSEAKSWRISDMVCVDLDESDVKSEGIFVDGIVYGGGVMSLKHTMEFKFDVENVKSAEFMELKVVVNSCDDIVAVLLKTSSLKKYLYAYHVEDEKIKGPIDIYGSEKMFAYVNSLVPISSAY